MFISFVIHSIPRRNERVSTAVHFAGLSWSHTGEGAVPVCECSGCYGFFEG